MPTILLSTSSADEAVGRRLAHDSGMGKLPETPPTPVLEQEKINSTQVLHDRYGYMHRHRYGCFAAFCVTEN